MAFIIIALFFLLILGAIGTVLTQILTVLMVIASLILTPFVWWNKNVTQPYRHARSEISRASQLIELRREEIRQQITSRNPLTALRNTRALFGEMIQEYRESSCSLFVEEALIDWVRSDWQALDNSSQEQANRTPGFARVPRLLSFLPRGRIVNEFAANEPIRLSANTEILFVPISIVRERNIQQIDADGPVIIYNDRDELPETMAPLRVNSNSAIFICNRELTGAPITVRSPRVVLQDVEELNALLGSDCDANCQGQVSALNYREILGRIQQLVTGN